MRIEFGIEGKLILHITEEEVERVNYLKSELISWLGDLGITQRDDLDWQTSSYISKSLIRKKLLAIRRNETLDEDYDDAFFDLFDIVGNPQVIKDDNMFIVFVSRYNMLQDEDEGRAVLEKISRIKVIDWMLDNWYNKESNSPRNISNGSIKIHKFDDNIFDSIESQKFIFHLLKHLLKDPKISFIKTVSFVFRQFWIKEQFKYEVYEGSNFRIISTIRDFEKYVQNNIISVFKDDSIDLLSDIGESTKMVLNSRIKLFKQVFEEQMKQVP